MPSDGSHRAPRLRISVVDDDGRPVRAPALVSWLAEVAPARARGAVTIAVVSDRRVRTLNRQYRGIDRTTDVLSFPADPSPVPRTPEHRNAAPHRGRRQTRVVPRSATTDAGGRAGDGAPFLGDIVIARGVAARQAREAGHAERVEWRVLALHGLLHLLGYDHEQDAGAMQRVERRLRRKGRLDAGLIEREEAG
jgi:probable rRNA maturation factor